MFGIHFGDDRQTLDLDSGGVEDEFLLRELLLRENTSE